MSTMGRIVVVAALLALVGCVLPNQFAEVQSDVADVREGLRRVQEDQEQARRRLTEVESRLAASSEQVTRADLAELRVEIEQVAGQVASSEERLTDLDRRVERLRHETQSREYGRSQLPLPTVPAGPSPGPTGVPPAPGATVAGALPDPEALYNTAYADFSKGNFALAISGFGEYAERFADSPLADNALYWVGECHFSQGDFGEAVAAFDRLLETYPRTDKAAAANLKKGLAFLEQNDVRRAIVQLRFVVTEHPQSDEAKIARDKLASLGAAP